jgi:hypothetical protein
MLSMDFWARPDHRTQNGQERLAGIVSEQAARRRKTDWHVGQHERFLGHAVRGHGEEGRGLHFQHQRQAHFRLLPTQKVTFVRQAIVCPDLPAPPASVGVGYRVE